MGENYHEYSRRFQSNIYLPKSNRQIQITENDIDVIVLCIVDTDIKNVMQPISSLMLMSISSFCVPHRVYRHYIC